MCAPFDWRRTGITELNEQAITNIPVQATAGDALRITCIWATRHDLQLLAPVHDATGHRLPHRTHRPAVRAVALRTRREARRISSRNSATSAIGFSVALADPPWLPLAARVAKNAVPFLCVPSAHLVAGHHLRLAKAWGFTHRSLLRLPEAAWRRRRNDSQANEIPRYAPRSTLVPDGPAADTEQAGYELGDQTDNREYDNTSDNVIHGRCPLSR
jgi:hypothetical protein